VVVIGSAVVKTSQDTLERMRRDTDVILATNAELVADLETLVEEGRQLRLVQAALMQQRRKLLEDFKQL
jgi:hypothetical protein